MSSPGDQSAAILTSSVAKFAFPSLTDGSATLEYFGWPDFAAIAARAVSIVVVLEAAGIVLFLVALHAHIGTHAEALRRSALRLALAGALLVIFQHAVAPIRLAASFAGIFDGSLHDFYFQSSAGIAHGIRLFGMLAIILGLKTRRRWLAVAGAGSRPRQISSPLVTSNARR